MEFHEESDFDWYGRTELCLMALYVFILFNMVMYSLLHTQGGVSVIHIWIDMVKHFEQRMCYDIAWI